MSLSTICIILGIAVVVFTPIYYAYAARAYIAVCSNCGKEFMATMKQLMFTTHAFSKVNLTCPHCGARDMMELKKR